MTNHFHTFRLIFHLKIGDRVQGSYTMVAEAHVMTRGQQLFYKATLFHRSSSIKLGHRNLMGHC